MAFPVVPFAFGFIVGSAITYLLKAPREGREVRRTAYRRRGAADAEPVENTFEWEAKASRRLH